MPWYAVRLEYLPANPARELELPTTATAGDGPRARTRWGRIRAHFLDRDRLGDATLVSLLADGLRPAEALAASWSGFDGRRLHVASHLRDGAPIEGTKRGRRTDLGPPPWVELAEPHAVDLAEWRIALGRPHGLIFPGRRTGSDGGSSTGTTGASALGPACLSHGRGWFRTSDLSRVKRAPEVQPVSLAATSGQ
jgi:hypothetical protein